MATALRPGGLYKNAAGKYVDANGRPADAPRASDGAGAKGNDEFDPTGRPALSGLKTAELEAVAKEEEVDLSGASNNDERRELIEKARAA